MPEIHNKNYAINCLIYIFNICLKIYENDIFLNCKLNIPYAN